jgi:hypothetical protein
MKTAKRLQHSLRILFPIVVTAFVISSCQKDELFPASPPASSSNNTVTEAVAVPQEMPYAVIKINHLAGRGPQYDYQVAVYSSLNVTFEGRRNTAFIGTKTFKIDETTFVMLKDMFVASHLFDLTPESAPSVVTSELADVPQVFTSFDKDGSNTVTLTDYYNPEATPELIKLRTQAEALLKIGYLINGK